MDKLVDFSRAIAYMLGMVTCGTVLTIMEVVTWPIFRFTDPNHAIYQRWTTFVARLCLRPFTNIHVKGAENLPKGAYVIACNHQSFVDPSICSFPLASVNFKSLMKQELLYYPGVGQTLWFAGHIAVKRGDKKHTTAAMDTALQWLGKGCPVLFYVEGTRKISGDTGPLGPFKPGAFIAAQKAGVPIVPMTISGARQLLPPRGLPRLARGIDVFITVHPPVPAPALSKPLAAAGGAAADAAAVAAAKERDTKAVDDTMARVRALIGSALRPIDDLPAASSKGAKAGAAAAGGANDTAAAASSSSAVSSSEVDPLITPSAPVPAAAAATKKVR